MNPGGRSYFLANACHVCKSKTTRNACQVCNMIFYCSPEHRRENWFEHSEICWAIGKICESGGRLNLWDLFDGKNFTNFRHEVANKCTSFLKRRLQPWEFEMIYYPRMCNVCREFDWTQLSTCKDCEFTYTCGKNHFNKNHAKWCKTLKIYSDLIIGQTLGFDLKPFDLEIKNQIYKSTSDVLKENIEWTKNSELKLVLTSEILTYPQTVFHGLKTINSIQDRKLVILFIGAETQAEVEPLCKWEKYLLHSLNDVECLILRFLGPELRGSSHELTGDLCDTCRNRRKNLKFQFITGKFYHEYSTIGTDEPNLICAFNSGMYRDFGFGNENSWKETIERLFARGNPPVLITEYTQRELDMVLERIKNSCNDVQVVVQPQMNPFASLKPGLNVLSEDEVPVIFKNYFYAVFMGNREKFDGKFKN